jgi:hypothetical protein
MACRYVLDGSTPAARIDSSQTLGDGMHTESSAFHRHGRWLRLPAVAAAMASTVAACCSCRVAPASSSPALLLPASAVVCCWCVPAAAPQARAMLSTAASAVLQRWGLLRLLLCMTRRCSCSAGHGSRRSDGDTFTPVRTAKIVPAVLWVWGGRSVRVPCVSRPLWLTAATQDSLQASWE